MTKTDIETKYNIGDEAWIVDRKIHQRVVDAISVKQKWEDLDIECVGESVTKYWVCGMWLESELFPTK